MLGGMWGTLLMTAGLAASLGPGAATFDEPCGTAHVGGLLGGDLALEERAAWDPLVASGFEPGGRDTCFAPSDVDNGGAYSLVAESEHFALFHQATPPQSSADGVLDALEDTLEILTAQGWRRPAHIDQQQMMVFLTSLPAGLGGYTWVADCPDAPNGTMDWIVLSEEWAAEEDLAEPLVAHELFHTVQRRYAYDEYVTGFEDSPSRWWVEASAVYQEGLVFPDELSLAEVRSAFWGQEPWKSLFLFDESAGRHYDVFVFPLSIEATLDDPAWHLPFWEQLDGRSGFDLRAELDTFLAPHGTDFDGEFSTYMARASEMDLPRYDYLLGPRDLQAFYGLDGGFAGRYAATELPVDGAVEAGAVDAPQGLGGNYVWFGTTAAPEGRALELRFEGDASTPEGEPVRWALEVVAARAGAIELRAHVEPVLETRGGVEVAVADVLVHGVRENLDGVWLVATRLDEAAGPAPGWRWEGRLVRGEGELSIEEGTGGCGCGAGTGSTPLIVISLLLPGFLLRRRW